MDLDCIPFPEEQVAMTNFLSAFVPLFASVDAFGLLPLFISMTEGMNATERKKVILQSVCTALLIALSFLLLGQAIFSLLGITVADFMIAGGVLLFIIALADLLTLEKKRMPMRPDSVGPVPLGTPLLAGPAVLTTSLMLLNAYGLLNTIIALVVNIAIAGILFHASEMLTRIMGLTGTRAISKITSLFLAAIAVMMIRRGVLEIALSIPR
jgi:multiple antibiotic resistance protein